MGYISDRIQSSTLNTKLSSKQKYNILYIAIFFVICILGYILYSYSTPNIKKVLFFKNIKHTDKEVIIPKNKLFKKSSGKEYSFSVWLRINNWYNNDNNEKNIFSYGHRSTPYSHTEQNANNIAVPSVWLDGIKNDLNIYVRTTSGSRQSPIKVKNVPLKKWFKLTIVMTGNSIQVFLNSKLDVFTFLSGDIVMPNGDLYLFTGKHKIDGEFSNFIFYNQALTATEVAKLYKVSAKPIKKSLLFKFVNIMKNIGKYKYDSVLYKDCENC